MQPSALQASCGIAKAHLTVALRVCMHKSRARVSAIAAGVWYIPAFVSRQIPFRATPQVLHRVVHPYLSRCCRVTQLGRPCCHFATGPGEVWRGRTWRSDDSPKARASCHALGSKASDRCSDTDSGIDEYFEIRSARREWRRCLSTQVLPVIDLIGGWWHCLLHTNQLSFLDGNLPFLRARIDASFASARPEKHRTGP